MRGTVHAKAWAFKRLREWRDEHPDRIITDEVFQEVLANGREKYPPPKQDAPGHRIPCPECGNFMSKDFGQVGQYVLECSNCGHSETVDENNLSSMVAGD